MQISLFNFFIDIFRKCDLVVYGAIKPTSKAVQSQKVAESDRPRWPVHYFHLDEHICLYPVISDQVSKGKISIKHCPN